MSCVLPRLLKRRGRRRIYANTGLSLPKLCQEQMVRTHSFGLGTFYSTHFGLSIFASCHSRLLLLTFVIISPWLSKDRRRRKHVDDQWAEALSSLLPLCPPPFLSPFPKTVQRAVKKEGEDRPTVWAPSKQTLAIMSSSSCCPYSPCQNCPKSRRGRRRR